MICQSRVSPDEQASVVNAGSQIGSRSCFFNVRVTTRLIVKAKAPVRIVLITNMSLILNVQLYNRQVRGRRKIVHERSSCPGYLERRKSKLEIVFRHVFERKERATRSRDALLQSAVLLEAIFRSKMLWNNIVQ